MYILGLENKDKTVDAFYIDLDRQEVEYFLSNLKCEDINKIEDISIKHISPVKHYKDIDEYSRTEKYKTNIIYLIKDNRIYTCLWKLIRR